MRLTATLAAVGLIAPGLPDWASAQAVLAGALPWQPAPCVIPPCATLPAAERRRIGLPVKLALAVGMQAAQAAQADTRALPCVFASSSGDGENCAAICTTLAGDDRGLSPTRFHNSVNNAAAGYWGIATGCPATSTFVAAYDGSFAAGLIEAMALMAELQEPVLLIACDLPYPEPLAATRPIACPFAVALLLDPAPADAPRLRLTGLTEAPASVLPEPWEKLRLGNPAARALPLLLGLAQRRSDTLRLDYLDDARLALELACP